MNPYPLREYGRWEFVKCRRQGYMQPYLNSKLSVGQFDGKNSHYTPRFCKSANLLFLADRQSHCGLLITV